MIRLYDHSNIDDLHWPNTPEGQYAKDYLYPLVKESTQRYIDNVKTDLQVLTINNLVLPITVNDTEYENSYVCSPYGQYISYSIEELYSLKKILFRPLIKGILLALGKLLKIGKINRVVSVNNWLLSTNLYPDIQPEQIELITLFLKKNFPSHLIVWRSINEIMHQPILHTLKYLGYYEIAGRIVYLFNSKDEKAYKKRNIKNDQKLLRNTDYEIVVVQDHKCVDRIRDLYLQLYLEKYFHLNPQYNARFFALAIQKKLLHVKALQKAGTYYAVLGYFIRNGVMTTPVLGYDLHLDQREGLYRRISAILLNDAQQLAVNLHCSSGAGSFKSRRGAKPHVEYNLFFGKHLSVPRRFILWLFQLLIQNIGLSFLRKHG